MWSRWSSRLAAAGCSASSRAASACIAFTLSSCLLLAPCAPLLENLGRKERRLSGLGAWRWDRHTHEKVACRPLYLKILLLLSGWMPLPRNLSCLRAGGFVCESLRGRVAIAPVLLELLLALPFQRHDTFLQFAEISVQVGDVLFLVLWLDHIFECLLARPPPKLLQRVGIH